jgi:hypothetical protein
VGPLAGLVIVKKKISMIIISQKMIIIIVTAVETSNLTKKISFPY